MFALFVFFLHYEYIVDKHQEENEEKDTLINLEEEFASTPCFRKWSPQLGVGTGPAHRSDRYS